MTDRARELLMEAYQSEGRVIYQLPGQLRVRANGKWFPKDLLRELQGFGYAEYGENVVRLTPEGQNEAQRLQGLEAEHQQNEGDEEE